MECMRIFLDANTLISGILFNGKEHNLLTKNNRDTLITSEDVLDETMKTITQKFPESVGLVDAFLKILDLTVIKRKEYINKLNKHNVVRDKNDRHILAAAVVSKSDYIVTGDADLLALKTYRNIHIVKTKKILSLIR
jgi:putative PIN family toxin of toxin-antitoxin system